MRVTWLSRLAAILATSALFGCGGFGGGRKDDPPTPIQVAEKSCTVPALDGLGIAGAIFTSATLVAATKTTPAYCDTLGSVDTVGNRAGFRVQLPVDWNRKLVFSGVGGTGGSVGAGNLAGVRKGYVTAVTDTGHQSTNNADASFALASPGVPNGPALQDYLYRAAHVTTEMAKSLAVRYYGRGAATKSYFDGCSNGGRMALMGAMRYPEDYDGIIVGAPFMTFRQFIGLLHSAKTQLLPGARIPVAMLPAIEAAYIASCDAVDGVTDGLIQNPARCSFSPNSLVCPGGNAANCLTAAQADGLNAHLLPLKSSTGEVLIPGFPPGIGNFQTYALGPDAPTNATAAQPWGTMAPARGWALADTTLKYVVNLDPNYNTQTFPHDVTTNTVGAAALAKFDQMTIGGNTDNPAHLDEFVRQKRKMIMYHGTDDHGLSYYQTQRFYDQLDLGQRGQGATVKAQIRLFTVPGMAHCGGGVGPNTFDMLAALENWVERGVAPDSIVASRRGRTMPLCPYPQAAKYKGTGDVMVAGNWECTANADMRIVGPDGVRATFAPPSP